MARDLLSYIYPSLVCSMGCMEARRLSEKNCEVHNHKPLTPPGIESVTYGTKVWLFYDTIDCTAIRRGLALFGRCTATAPQESACLVHGLHYQVGVFLRTSCSSMFFPESIKNQQV